MTDLGLISNRHNGNSSLLQGIAPTRQEKRKPRPSLASDSFVLICQCRITAPKVSYQLGVIYDFSGSHDLRLRSVVTKISSAMQMIYSLEGLIAI